MIRPHARTLKITGGEPTLHPEFAKILNSIDQIGIPYTIFTNGRWKKPVEIIGLLKGIKHLGGLLVSLHGPNATVHEAFTGVAGSFDQTCSSIQFATKSGLRVHTSTVLNSYNLHLLYETVILARSLNAKRAVFNRFLGTPNSPYQPTQPMLKKAIETIDALRATYPPKNGVEFGVRYGNCIPQCFKPSGSSGCWAGVAYCTIDPWGNVRPCNHSPTVVGNIFEKSIREIWECDAMQEWRSLLNNSCYTCGAFEKCHGGCPALSEIDPSGRDPLICSPTKTQPDIQVELYEHAKTTLNGDILPTNIGYALVRNISIFPITEEAKPIMNDLIKSRSLAELKSVYGQDGLNFVGALVVRGFVTLQY